MTQLRPDHTELDRTETAGSTAQDPRFLPFLADRLCEEVVAATYRRQLANADTIEVAERGLRMLGELLDVLGSGGVPDRMSLDLLTLAYDRHPDFHDEWNRWRHPRPSTLPR